VKNIEKEKKTKRGKREKNQTKSAPFPLFVISLAPTVFG